MLVPIKINLTNIFQIFIIEYFKQCCLMYLNNSSLVILSTDYDYFGFTSLNNNCLKHSTYLYKFKMLCIKIIV